MARATAWAEQVGSLYAARWSEEAANAVLRVWRFVGLERRSDSPPFESDAPRLWRYELQYRGWLPGLAQLSRKGAIEPDAWREYVGASLRSQARDLEAWEPYVLARRIPNELAAAGISGDENLLTAAGRAVGVLRFMPEIHLASNHLLVDRAALALGGLIFQGRTHTAAERRFVSEVRAQTDSEGLHEERSPWYGLLAWLDLQNVIGGRRVLYAPESELDEISRSQRNALARMIHPDGTLASFHDSSSDHPYREVAKSISVPDAGSWCLRASGYCGWRGEVQGAPLSMILDFGETRPRHQPSHQHGCPLAMELWWGGAWIRALGISTYESSPRRLFERGVRAYATVQLDDREPAEIWSAFRMGRGYRMFELDYRKHADGFEAGRSHDGFAGSVVSRSVSWRASTAKLIISDAVVARDRLAHTMTSRLPLAPEVRVRRERGIIRFERDGRCIELTAPSDVDVTVKSELAHPAFGVPQETHVVELRKRFEAHGRMDFDLFLRGTD